ncbi:MAG: site-2 protease family protein [Deltaproteobacteria bacterium]
MEEFLLRVANSLSLLGISFAAGIFVVTIHEYAHAFTSWRMGDNLPRFGRRVSLNPLKHVDIVGLLFMVQTGFGWGKPVQTSPKNYKDKKKGTILNGISGPLANVLLAAVMAFIIAFIDIFAEQGKIYLAGYKALYLITFLKDTLIFSLNLALVSLMPMKPYDGFMIWGGVIPSKNQFKIFQYQGVILAFFLLIILISPEIFSTVTRPLGGLLELSARGIVHLII